MTVFFVESMGEVNSRLNYYMNNPDSDFEKINFADDCQKYPYLTPTQNNIKCLYPTKHMSGLRKSQNTQKLPKLAKSL